MGFSECIYMQVNGIIPKYILYYYQTKQHLNKWQNQFYREFVITKKIDRHKSEKRYIYNKNIYEDLIMRMNYEI